MYDVLTFFEKTGRQSPAITRINMHLHACNKDVLSRGLVGGFNPFKNISQIGSFPQVGVKIKISETTT